MTEYTPTEERVLNVVKVQALTQYLSAREVAERAGTTRDTVKVLISRIRRKLPERDWIESGYDGYRWKGPKDA